MAGIAVFDDKYKNMSNSSPPSPVQFHTIYSTQILYVDQLETIALTAEIKKYERNKNTSCGYVAVQLFRTSILTHFHFEMKIR